jgi:hypothetical protein
MRMSHWQADSRSGPTATETPYWAAQSAAIWGPGTGGGTWAMLSGCSCQPPSLPTSSTAPEERRVDAKAGSLESAVAMPSLLSFTTLPPAPSIALTPEAWSLCLSTTR